ncbi:rRNA maturation RNase YbeY [Bacteroidia bacterium]|nr:rRNA maturation RNase YbeY [Bacteroidia bacterium]
MIQIIEQDTATPQDGVKTIEKAITATLHNTKYNVVVNLCSDQFMLEQNTKSLGHNYYTDIITYYYDEENPLNDAELLISLDRVKENANNLKVPVLNELARVVIHGCLHLTGFNDTTETEQQAMRLEENKILQKVFHVER